MQQASPTKATEKTSTILSHYLKVALMRSLISEWSRPQQIEVLREMLMEVSNPRRQSVSERNDEFRSKLRAGAGEG